MRFAIIVGWKEITTRAARRVINTVYFKIIIIKVNGMNLSTNKPHTLCGHAVRCAEYAANSQLQTDWHFESEYILVLELGGFR